MPESCPLCRAPVPGGLSACPSCGAPIRPSVASARPAPRSNKAAASKGCLAFASLPLVTAGTFVLLAWMGGLKRKAVEPADFPGKPEAVCGYRDCPEPSGGVESVAVLTGESQYRGNRIVLEAQARQVPLCAGHAACNRREKWPDNPYLFLSILKLGGISVFAGLLAFSLLLYRAIRRAG